MSVARYWNWYLGQWSEINAGGFPAILRKARTALRLSVAAIPYVINAIWAIPAVLLIRVLRPWVHVRIGTFWSSRIGHFIADASILLARRDLRSHGSRTIDLYCIPGNVCNEQWARMVRRRFFTRWWVRYLDASNKIIPGGASHALVMPTEATVNRVIYSCFRESTARFDFTPEEENAAKAWLRRRGWRDGDLFVCLLVRDSAYLSSDPLHSGDGSSRWNYHNYRDSDIDTYVEAVQALVDRGYWIIRMGKVMRKRLSLQHQRVIDYAFSEDQDDLMDIWLSVNCHFFISTGTGIDVIPAIYARPAVFVNALPLVISGASWHQNIWVPKHLRWKDTGTFLTLREHCLHGYGFAEEYEQAGISIEDLSSAEITAAVIECERRLAGTWIETDEDKARQRRYWDTLQNKWPDFRNFHDYIHPEARVGSAWLKSMGEAFLG